MNSITLNGTVSTSITGLLIQSLPPISKPAMRVLVEEIDGRDGDITTDLGYQAYDKTFMIGLHGNYNINDVIGYFSSEGTVVFSNESDKYYHYKIISQIDFEKLIRFKQATVVMHVQPFKYKLNESAVTLTRSGSVTNAGNTISRPTITITGSGTVNLSINGSQVFAIDMSGSIGSITIDSEEMEAYKDSTLLNRRVTGDYDKCVLNPGSNSVSWSGSVTSVVFNKYSRWI